MSRDSLLHLLQRACKVVKKSHRGRLADAAF
jgi:hypothetical protein